ncbi:AcaB family transcriptional regulator [Pseudorhodoferax soli]|uniref:Uncharacterized protein DUF1845 n=1 Tax=Pseudorhodoferax soli TaxID=545864 RepID=A0A368XGI4_9BURK|nr:AcaB family transcriptional regulator [Pseudorhodoferax soli]RCW65124.1 uncharacterized protein DUF1845 [Pseudorhodoferax soli]
MTETKIVKTDRGAVNARILSKEGQADYRRVEVASIKIRTHFTSAEAKRMFMRMFSTLQLNAHFITVIARSRADHRDVEAVEATLRSEIEATKKMLNDAIDAAEKLFKAHGIDTAATYDTQPLEVEIGILSSNGRRYLEVIGQLDQLMPLLQTLEIYELISTEDLDKQRAALKRQIKGVATSARRLATGLRRRMAAAESREPPHADAEEGALGQADVPEPEVGALVPGDAASGGEAAAPAQDVPSLPV